MTERRLLMWSHSLRKNYCRFTIHTIQAHPSLLFSLFLSILPNHFPLFFMFYSFTLIQYTPLDCLIYWVLTLTIYIYIYITKILIKKIYISNALLTHPTAPLSVCTRLLVLCLFIRCVDDHKNWVNIIIIIIIIIITIFTSHTLNFIINWNHTAVNHLGVFLNKLF